MIKEIKLVTYIKEYGLSLFDDLEALQNKMKLPTMKRQQKKGDYKR